MPRELLIGGADPAPPAPPAPVPVAGVASFSTVDWPGRLAATAFLAGCPWRCGYCHNPALQTVRGGAPDAGAAGWAELTGLLAARRGLLDAVVFSGGEPTMHRGLPAAVDAVRGLGFDVGLHTCGAYPVALRRLLAGGRVDWVGLDVKADPGDSEGHARVVYGGLGAGRGGVPAARLRAAEHVRRSLALVLDAAPAVEVRTTVWPGATGAGELAAIGRRLRAAGDAAGRGDLIWAIQHARTTGVDPTAAATAGLDPDAPAAPDAGRRARLLAAAREAAGDRIRVIER